jgi:Fe-S oxidoreductase
METISNWNEVCDKIKRIIISDNACHYLFKKIYHPANFAV